MQQIQKKYKLLILCCAGQRPLGSLTRGTQASAKVLKIKNEIAIGAEASYLVARKTRAFYGDGYSLSGASLQKRALNFILFI